MVNGPQSIFHGGSPYFTVENGPGSIYDGVHLQYTSGEFEIYKYEI